jgi:hypothetical protein
MTLPLHLICLCAAPLALAACHGGKKPDEARTAQGEILPGSASDAMLPLDTVRSQPPLAPREEASGKPGHASAGAKGTQAPAGDASDEAGAPSPGATPTPSIAPDPAVQ